MRTYCRGTCVASRLLIVMLCRGTPIRLRTLGRSSGPVPTPLIRELQSVTHPLLRHVQVEADHRPVRSSNNIEKLTSQQTTRSRRTKDEKGEADYLYGIKLSCVKHFASAWSLPLSTEGKDNRSVQMTKIVLLYRADLPRTVITGPWSIRI